MMTCERCFWCDDCQNDYICDDFAELEEDEDMLIEARRQEFYKEWTGYMSVMHEW